MRLIRFFFSKYFWLNLVIAGLVVGAGIYVLLNSLDTYTHHGEKIEVPDLSGVDIDSVPNLLAEFGLRDTILDSIFDLQHPRGTILEQNPKAGSWVKQNRLIYLTVNARGVQMIDIPDGLLDFGVTRVANELEGRSLNVGRRKYVMDKCPGCVIGLEYRGKTINAGDKVPKGSQIDLVIGMGLEQEAVEIPMLYGLSLREADRKLGSLMLAYRVLYYEGKYHSLNDSLAAKVYWMDPSYTIYDKRFVDKGGLVKLKVTTIENNVPTLAELDSLSNDTILK